MTEEEMMNTLYPVIKRYVNSRFFFNKEDMVQEGILGALQQFRKEKDSNFSFEELTVRCFMESKRRILVFVTLESENIKIQGSIGLREMVFSDQKEMKERDELKELIPFWYSEKQKQILLGNAIAKKAIKSELRNSWKLFLESNQLIKKEKEDGCERKRGVCRKNNKKNMRKD